MGFFMPLLGMLGSVMSSFGGGGGGGSGGGGNAPPPLAAPPPPALPPPPVPELADPAIQAQKTKESRRRSKAVGLGQTLLAEEEDESVKNPTLLGADK